jgi:hypothetical protein
MTDATSNEDVGRLFLEMETPERLRVDLQPSKTAWGYAHANHDGELPRRPLVRFDTSTKTIHIYPLRTAPSMSVMTPKYGPVREIAFEGVEFTLPENEYEVEDHLRELDDHFYHQPIYGLGIRAPYRPIIDVIAGRGFRRLVISRARDTLLDYPTFVLSQDDLDEISFELGRIADRFSSQSRTERLRHVHNELLARRFPERFARDERRRDKDILVSLLRRTEPHAIPLSAADREALVTRAAEEAPALARRNRHQLYKLQRDFELAGLNDLISRFEADLAKPHPETFWQNLLKFNPFILSMLFGYPIVLVRDQAHVGGQRLDGTGETIIDFLLRNASTDNLAIVEIKTPGTVLMGNEFRAGRYRPSAALNGAVIQVIDQRYELLVNYNSRAREAGKAHAVDCVVVAGRRPADADRLASFEMYRNSLKDVRIYTFDEVLLKLQALREYLALPPGGERKY